jgi:hypothetical protein
MRFLVIGDIVGRPGRNYLSQQLYSIKEERKIDFIIANGENAAGGSSITVNTANEIFRSGVDVITTGDHIFKKSDARQVLEDMDVVRPLNYGDLAYGQGYIIKEKLNQPKIAVVNLIGRVFMQPVDCPFKALDSVLQKLKEKVKVIIVDVHAEATSEKLALGYFASGRTSAVLGTHTHIPTADERIIDDYTAYITDLGMTGSFDSVLGRKKEKVIQRFVTNLPHRFNLAHNDLRIQGVIIDVNPDNGRATAIERVEYKQDDQNG